MLAFASTQSRLSATAKPRAVRRRILKSKSLTFCLTRPVCDGFLGNFAGNVAQLNEASNAMMHLERN